MVKCSFAEPGTYGHECGKPAIIYAVKASDITKTGFYYAGRCSECKTKKYGENRNVIRFEEIEDQKNEFV